MEIKKEIISKLKRQIGEFRYKLIYRKAKIIKIKESNLVYLLKTKNGAYILKIKNKENDNLLEEVKRREVLEKLLEKAKVKHYLITKVLAYDLKDNWILFKYEKFYTLKEIAERNIEEFCRVAIGIFEDFFNKLFKKYGSNKKVPGDYTLVDLGYYKNKLYLFDLEKEKPLIEQYVDLYSKVCKLYFEYKKNKEEKKAKKLEDLIKNIKQSSSKKYAIKMNFLLNRLFAHPKFKDFESEIFDPLKEKVMF